MQITEYCFCASPILDISNQVYFLNWPSISYLLIVLSKYSELISFILPNWPSNTSIFSTLKGFMSSQFIICKYLLRCLSWWIDQLHMTWFYGFIILLLDKLVSFSLVFIVIDSDPNNEDLQGKGKFRYPVR